MSDEKNKKLSLKVQKIVKFVIITTILVVVSNIAIDNPYTHRLIKGYIKKTFAKNEKIGVDFNGLSVSLVPPGIEAYGLSINNKQQKNQLLNTTHIKAELSLKWLLVGKFKLSKVLIENSILDLESVNSLAGSFNSKSSQAGKDSWPPTNESFIERFEVKNLALKGKESLIDTDPWVVDLNHINLNLEINSWSEFAGSFEASDLSIQDDVFSFLERGQFRTKFEISDENLELVDMVLIGNRLGFEGETVISNAFNKKNKIVKVTGKSSGDLSILGNFLDFEETYGQVSSEIQALIGIPTNGDVSVKINGKGKADNAFLAGFRLIDSEANFSITNNFIEFKSIKLFDGVNHLGDGNGRVVFNNEGSYSFNILPKSLPLSTLLDILTVDFETVNGVMTKGKVKLFGTSSPFKMTVDGPTNLHDFKIAVMPIWPSTEGLAYPSCDLNLYLEIDNEAVNYGNTNGNCVLKDDSKDELELRSGLALSGQTRFDGKMKMNVDVETENLNVFSKFLGAPLEGEGKINTLIYGPYESIKVNIDSNLQKFSAYNAFGGDVFTRLQFDTNNLKLALKKARLSLHPENQITLDGSHLDFARNKAIFKLDVLNSPEEQVKSIVPIFLPNFKDTGGSIDTLSAKFSLDFNNMNKSIFNVTANTQSIDYMGSKIFSSFKGDIFLNSNKISTKKADVDLTGKMPLELNFELKNKAKEKTWENLFSQDSHIKTDFKSLKTSIAPIHPSKDSTDLSILDQSNLRELPFIGDSLGSMGIGGQLSIDGELTGKIKSPKGVLESTSTNTYLLGTKLTPISAKLFLEDGKLTSNFKQTGSTLIGTFNTDLNKPGYPFDSFSRFTNFDVKFLLPKATTLDARNYLYATGNAKFKGKLSDFWKSEAKVTIEKLDAHYVHSSGMAEHTIAGTLKNGFSLDLKNSKLESSIKNVTFSHNFGEVVFKLKDSTLPDSLNLNIDSSLDIGFMKSYFQEVEESEGSILFSGSLIGNILDPIFNFRVKNTSYTSLGLSYIRPSFQDIKLDLGYNRGRLTVNTLTGQKGPGSLLAQGSLNFGEKTGETISIYVKNSSFNFDAPVIRNTETTVNSNLILSGSELPLKLTGTIEVDKARANKNVNWQTEILNSVSGRNIVDDTIERKKYLGFDIDLISRDTIFIENKSLNINLGHNLKLEGDNSNLILTGTLDIASGKIKYKKDYSITRGIVSFDDRQKIDPNLDISAISEISNYKVTVDVTGKSSDPKVEFSIDPPTKDDGSLFTQLDILILMATGNVPQDNQNESDDYTLGYEAMNAFFRGLDDLLDGLLTLTGGEKIFRQIYVDTYPSEVDGKLLFRANAPINTREDLELVIQGDAEKVGIKAEYELEESISTSVNYSKIHNSEEGASSEDSEDIDATVDLRFRFLFP